MGVVKSYVKTFGFSLGKLYRFSLPIISTQLLAIFPLLVAFWMLSKLGQRQMAAAAIGIPMYYVIQKAFAYFSSSFGVVVSHTLGEGSCAKDRLCQYAHSAAILACVLSLTAGFIMLIFPILLPFLGQPSPLIPILKGFFYFSALRVSLAIFNAFLKEYFFSMHFPWYGPVLACVRFPLIIFLSYAFILGHFGMPALALSGFALAPALAGTVQLILSLLFIRLNKSLNLNKMLFGCFKGSIKSFKEMFLMGCPMVAQQVGTRVALVVLVVLTGLYGERMLAGWGVVNQFIIIFWVISRGLSTALKLMTSYSNAQKKAEAVRQHANVSFLLIASFSILVSFFFVVTPDLLISLYRHAEGTSSSEWVIPAKYFMYIAAFYLFSYGFRAMLTASFQGLGDVKFPMRVVLSWLWFFALPLAVIVSFFFIPGAISLRACYVFGSIFPVFMLYRQWRKKMASLSVSHS